MGGKIVDGILFSYFFECQIGLLFQQIDDAARGFQLVLACLRGEEQRSQNRIFQILNSVPFCHFSRNKCACDNRIVNSIRAMGKTPSKTGMTAGHKASKN